MRTYPPGPADRAGGADLAKLYALALGIVLTVLGVLGFIPPVTPNGSIFTIFATDPVHNFFYLITGLSGLGVALADDALYSRMYAAVIGVLYGVVTIIGFIDGHAILAVMSTNLGDNILDLVIAVTALAVCVLSSLEAARRTLQLNAERQHSFA